MIALELVDVKNFMNKLLRTEVFDHFLLQEATINTGASFFFNDKANTEIYTKQGINKIKGT